MRVGCGLRVRRIDGNEYLYFWHYEREAGRSARREDYVGPARDAGSRRDASRSEEHTSELQSRLHLVCRHLPEKKKQDYRSWLATHRSTSHLSCDRLQRI